MMLVGMTSWIQSSTGAPAVQQQPVAPIPKRRPGLVRAGVATALLALALIAGVAHPGETLAKKSTSPTCTTLEAGFNYAGRAAVTARLNGLNEQAENWTNMSNYLQSLYLDLDCSITNPIGETA